MNLRDFVNKIDVYNLMIFNLFVFYLIANFIFDWVELLQVPIAVLSAGFLDTAINYFKNRNFEISKTGVISGFFIGLVLANNQIWYVPAVASAIAIFGKHIGSYFMGFFGQRKHVFNPAMIGIFLSILIFKTTDGWAGAANLMAVAILGLFLLYKFRRFHLVIPFFLTYLIILFLLTYFLGDISNFINRILDSTIYFFAAFMLVEPMTSPVRTKGRIIYGILSGVIIALTTMFLPIYSLTLGLLVCNLFVPLINKIE